MTSMMGQTSIVCAVVMALMYCDLCTARNSVRHLEFTPLRAEHRFNPQDASLQPIRFLAAYDRVDNPSLDKYPTAAPRACTSEGQILYFSDDGTANSSWTTCSAASGLVDNCKYACTADDVMTPAKRAMLRGNLTAAFLQLSGLLSLMTTPGATLDINVNDCNGVPVVISNVSTDVYIIVTARPEFHTEQFFAATSSSCLVDSSTGRPVAGFINVVPSSLRSNRTDLTSSLVHELIHILGFSPQLFPLFRHPNDPSKTYYQYSSSTYPTGIVAGVGVIDYGQGNFSIDTTALGAGKVIRVISPNVLNVAQTYFGCNTLTGMELENGGNPGTSIAAHWEKRLLPQELMVAAGENIPGVISAFTLALLQDSGWYAVKTDQPAPMTWGNGAGCNFVTQPCQQWSDSYFCTVPDSTGSCSADRTFTGLCDIAITTEDLPPPYQHFPGNNRSGGNDMYADYCPTVISVPTTGGQGLCTDPTNVVSGKNPFSIRTGPASRCFKSTTVTTFQDPNGVDGSISTARNNVTLCAQMVCGGGVPRVRVGKEYFQCTDGSTIELLIPPGFRDTNDTRNYSIPSTATHAYVSYDSNGIFQCGTFIGGINSVCTPGNVRSTGIPTIANWPRIDAVWPNSTDIYPPTGSSGEFITIAGANLNQNCSSIRVGGIDLDNFTVYNSSVAVAVTKPLVYQFGGSGPQGSGIVDVELRCVIPSICPEGCIMSRLVGQFEYTIPATPNMFAPSLTGFLQTTNGRVVAGCISAFFGSILIWIAIECRKLDKRPADYKPPNPRNKGKKPKVVDDVESHKPTLVLPPGTSSPPLPHRSSPEIEPIEPERARVLTTEEEDLL